MPVRDILGRVVYFNDRALDHSLKMKSMHSSDSKATSVLHGLWQSGKKKNGIVCEGAFDMMQIYSVLRHSGMLGTFGVVNLMGVVLNDARASLLSKFYDTIYLMLDNDDAGREATCKIWKNFKDDLDLRICTWAYPENKDPGVCTSQEILGALKHSILIPKPMKHRTLIDWIARKIRC